MIGRNAPLRDGQAAPRAIARNLASALLWGSDERQDRRTDGRVRGRARDQQRFRRSLDPGDRCGRARPLGRGAAEAPAGPLRPPGEETPPLRRKAALPRPAAKAGDDAAAGDSDSATPEGDRIAKAIARAGIASRRDVEAMIAEGRVTLNGKVLTSPAINVTDADEITVDGEAPARPRADPAVDLSQAAGPRDHGARSGRTPDRFRGPARGPAARGRPSAASTSTPKACCFSPTMAASPR